MANRTEGDLVVTGVVYPQGGVQLPDSQKLLQKNLAEQLRKTISQSGSAVDATHVVHIATGATSLVKSVKVTAVTAAVGDSTVTVDLKKNGTTMLTGVITLDSGDAAYAVLSGTFTGTPSLAVGDVLTVVIDATVGTGTLPTGLGVQVDINEDNVT